MSKYPLANRAGIAQTIIKKAVGKDIPEEKLFKFLHGDINTIYKTLPKPSNEQSWETSGKRYVHLEETKFIAGHLIRNGCKPVNERALILSGTDPALACLPWVMSNVSYRFDAYEKDLNCWKFARKRISKETEKIKEKAPKNKKIELNLIYGDILDANKKYGVIDLDFCNNHLRTSSSRRKIIELIERVSPDKGPFILRTTLHVGRQSNSRESVTRNIDDFEESLRRGPVGYRIKAHNQSPYQSTLPMISLVWILERKEQLEQKESRSRISIVPEDRHISMIKKFNTWLSQEGEIKNEDTRRTKQGNENSA